MRPNHDADYGSLLMNLNCAKEAIGSLRKSKPGFDWRSHTSACDDYSTAMICVSKANLFPHKISMSFLKLYEIFRLGLITPSNGRTLHLCEYPGGFCLATKYFFKEKGKNNLDQTCVSLLFDEKASTEVRPLVPELKFDRLEDGSGDIAVEGNFAAYAKKGKRYRFITADGGCNPNQNWNGQEEEFASLLRSEIMWILNLLDDGCDAVIKLLGFHDSETQFLIFLVTSFFKRAYLFKPKVSSDATNEVYLVLCQYNLEQFLASETSSELTKFQYDRLYFACYDLTFRQIAKIRNNLKAVSHAKMSDNLVAVHYVMRLFHLP